MNTETLAVWVRVTRNELTFTCEVSYDPADDSYSICKVTDLQGNPAPLPSEDECNKIIELAKIQLPHEVCRVREVRHFRHSEGRFSIAILDGEIWLNSLAGKCPTLPVFLAALQKMTWFPVVAKAQLESGQFFYTVQMTGKIGKSFRLREARNMAIHDYPVRAHLRISGSNRVQDFRMLPKYLVPILHYIDKMYWYLHWREIEVEEVPVFQPDSEPVLSCTETIKAVPGGGFELIKAAS